MEDHQYTAIPDTTDSLYWEQKPGNLRSTIFIPRDKELHQRLRAKAWSAIQASLSKRNRKVSK